MIEIGGKPILCTENLPQLVYDFAICWLQGHVIKEYFANYFHQSDVTFDLKNSIEM